MATLLYLAMRLLWRDRKRKFKHPKYGYEDDADDCTNDDFSDLFFVDEEGHEEKLEKDHDEEQEEKYPPRNNPEKDNQSRDGSDTKQDTKKTTEKGTQTEEDDLKITVSIGLKGKELIAAKQTHQGRVVLRLAGKNIRSSGYSASDMGKDTVSIETTVENTETISESIRTSLD
ncbi:hypothetical protein PISL3812_06995 [Talaromyces islandicus]|uniref:Uncharacterized protein n=1 Tax=Talaromyces islandicus TaxID=28573 RepID=A0A0U1M324_TALIS|nr:hypothetical protein PISL3812_06995 [Talaromyces islandicus]